MYEILFKITAIWGREELRGVGLAIRVMKGGIWLAGPSVCGLPLANPSNPSVHLRHCTQLEAVPCCIALKDWRSILSAFPVGRKPLQKHWRNCYYCQFRVNWLILEKEHSEPFLKNHKLRRGGRWCSSGAAAAGALKQVRKEQVTAPGVTCFCVSPSSPS